MRRLIDADLLEEHFKKVIKHYEKGESSLCETKCKLLEGAFRDVLARIESQPTVEERPKGEWIPVTDRLPDLECDALLTVDRYSPIADEWIIDDVICSRFDKSTGKFWIEKEMNFVEYPVKVKAWMPLPEPYKKSIRRMNQKDNDNCCKNCSYAREYNGHDDFYCEYYDLGRRAEKYDCENFKLDMGE